MDYNELAMEFLSCMGAVQRMKPHKHIEGALRGEEFVLGYIAHNGGKALPGEIGSNMKVSTARVAAALNNLEKKGYITRQIDPGNRRQILVELTKEGRDLTEKHQENVLSYTMKMLELLGEDDAKEYVRIMRRLADNLPNICE
jgi:DNA-binding MarR family transcriptional regulator